jgi:hypothetical protein
MTLVPLLNPKLQSDPRQRCANFAFGALDQRCNQAQELLLLRSVAGRDEKGSDLDVGDLPARGKIRLVPHEHPAAVGIKGEQPPIAVVTDINGSDPNGHVGSLQRTAIWVARCARAIEDGYANCAAAMRLPARHRLACARYHKRPRTGLRRQSPTA